jgi:hypothetical protein
VKGVGAARGLVVASTKAYWVSSSDGNLSSVKTDGTDQFPSSLLSSGQALDAEALVLAGGSFYWTTMGTSNAVLQVAAAGGDATKVATTEFSPYGITADATYVYWANNLSIASAIRKIPLAGGTPQDVVTGSSVAAPTRVLVDATYIYWSNAGTGADDASVYRAKLDGSEPTALSSGQPAIYGLAIDATTVYFSNSDGNAVLSVPIAGGDTVPFATGEDVPMYVIVDGTDVLWIDSGNGTIRRKAKSGGTAETLASSADLGTIDQDLGKPQYLAVDGTSVYWTDAGKQYLHGAVLKASK